MLTRGMQGGRLDRFAAIADVHGNRWALTAVLTDIDRRGITEVVNLGDHLFGPLDPDGTAEILMSLGAMSVAGNQDRELLEPGASQLIRLAQRDWMSSMPGVLQMEDILLFHGTPTSDTQYLLETVRGDGVTLATEREIQERLAGEAGARLMLCGHTHIPRLVAFHDVLIVNPGSVGLQAYEDDQPMPHAMETGSPHARYAIVERTGKGWNVDLLQVRYDWDSAALEASANGRHDWAYRISTGRAR